LGGGGGMMMMKMMMKMMIIECDYECEWNGNKGMIKRVAIRLIVVDGVDVQQDGD
jgi:hypothetical protein